MIIAKSINFFDADGSHNFFGTKYIIKTHRCYQWLNFNLIIKNIWIHLKNHNVFYQKKWFLIWGKFKGHLCQASCGLKKRYTEKAYIPTLDEI